MWCGLIFAEPVLEYLQAKREEQREILPLEIDPTHIQYIKGQIDAYTKTIDKIRKEMYEREADS